MPPLPEVYIGNLPPGTTESDLWNELRPCRIESVYNITEDPSGNLRGFFVARCEDLRDALNAVRDLNGRNGWIVKHHWVPGRCYGCGESDHVIGECSVYGHRGNGGCYRCGEPHHLVRNCPQVRGRWRERSTSHNRRNSDNRHEGRDPIERRFPVRQHRDSTQRRSPIQRRRRRSHSYSRSPSYHRRARHYW